MSWAGPTEAKVSWMGPAEAKVSWTEPTLGVALEALTLVGARVALTQRNALEAQTLGRARVALTLVSFAIVKSGQNKSLKKELCCMFRDKGPDLLNII